MTGPGGFKLPFSFRKESPEKRRSKRLSAARALAEKNGLPTQYVIPHEHVQILPGVLGRGAFGVVQKCTLKKGWAGEAVVKRVSPKRLAPTDASLLRAEMKIWSALEHEHCVRFIGVCLDPAEFLLVCEFCNGGALHARHVAAAAAGRAPLPPRTLAWQLGQVASGVAYLHSCGVIHRDIKSANVLVQTRPGADEKLLLSDFGLACFAPKDRAEHTAETGSYRCARTHRAPAQFRRGARVVAAPFARRTRAAPVRRWMAPEVVRHEPYNSLCDVYSFGMLGWEMLTYTLPFADVEPVQAREMSIGRRDQHCRHYQQQKKKQEHTRTLSHAGGSRGRDARPQARAARAVRRR